MTGRKWTLRESSHLPRGYDYSASGPSLSVERKRFGFFFLASGPYIGVRGNRYSFNAERHGTGSHCSILIYLH